MTDYDSHDDTTAYAKACAPDALDIEVRAGSFAAKIDGLITHDGGVDSICVKTTSALTGAEKTELDGIISSHTP